MVVSSGPSFGYLPEPSKSCMVVSNEWMESAHDIFGDFGIFIASHHPFLGGAIDNSVGCLQFTIVQGNIDHWDVCAKNLTVATSNFPQPALMFLVQSLQCEWNHMYSLGL